MYRTKAPSGGSLKQTGSNNERRPAARTSDPVLLIMHQKTSCAGAVGNWLSKHGYQLDIKRPVLGDALPETLDQHAGLIVFGGPMSANDDTPELRKELDWLALCLKENVPYFGICLGAQMMVRQLGGEITGHKDGLVEIGYHPIKASPAGKSLMDHWPDYCFQWHKEGFSLPAGTTSLATGKRFEHQAYCYGDHIYGVQFHPEITREIMQRWSKSAAHMLIKKGAHNEERLLLDHQKYEEAQLNWLHHFMKHWTSLFKTA